MSPQLKLAPDDPAGISPLVVPVPPEPAANTVLPVEFEDSAMEIHRPAR